MDVESRAAEPEAAVGAVDWRGRPCRAHRHGGMRAAVFVLGTRPRPRIACQADEAAASERERG